MPGLSSAQKRVKNARAANALKRADNNGGCAGMYLLYLHHLIDHLKLCAFVILCMFITLCSHLALCNHIVVVFSMMFIHLIGVSVSSFHGNISIQCTV